MMVYAEDEEGGFHLDEDSIRELLEAGVTYLSILKSQTRRPVRAACGL